MCTLCPDGHRNARSRPLISGAILISVAWTTPGALGAATPEPQDQKSQMAAAAASASEHRDAYEAALASPRRHRPTPIDARRRAASDGEHEIDRGQQPQIEPVGAHLEEPRAHLVDAHEAVDRRFAGKDAAELVEERRDHLARPGHADQKELRQGGRDEDQDRRLAMLEEAPAAWPMKLVARMKGSANSAMSPSRPRVEKP